MLHLVPAAAADHSLPLPPSGHAEALTCQKHTERITKPADNSNDYLAWNLQALLAAALPHATDEALGPLGLTVPLTVAPPL